MTSTDKNGTASAGTTGGPGGERPEANEARRADAAVDAHNMHDVHLDGGSLVSDRDGSDAGRVGSARREECANDQSLFDVVSAVAAPHVLTVPAGTISADPRERTGEPVLTTPPAVATRGRRTRSPSAIEIVISLLGEHETWTDRSGQAYVTFRDRGEVVQRTIGA